MSTKSGVAPIVVGVDGTHAGLQAVRWAAGQARRQKAPLTLVHALPRLPRDPYPTTALYIKELRAASRADSAHMLDEAAAVAAEVAGDVAVTTEHHDGAATEVLSRMSAAARMVVIGAVGRVSVADVMIGSTALDLPARSHAPVVIVRDRADGTLAESGPVVVAVSGYPYDDASIDFAFEYASECGAALLAVHAWSDAALPEFDLVAGGAAAWREVEQREQRALSERLAGHVERYPDVRVQEIIVPDRPARALIDRSADAQLLVTGTRGRGPLTGAILGSTSRAVGRAAHCPVAIIRHYD